MKNFSKILLANIALFSAAAVLADDYTSNSYQAPIHQNGRMPDGAAVYEQNMQSRPQDQNWIYDPAVSSQWRQTNSLPQGQDYNPTASYQPDYNPENQPNYNPTAYQPGYTAPYQGQADSTWTNGR